MRYLPPGTLVRVTAPSPFAGKIAKVVRHFPATENYLTHIDGTTDTMWLSEEYLEAA